MSAETAAPAAPVNPLLEGPILRSIWNLALPAMAASGVQICFDLTHTFWVGKLGPSTLAALTGASFVVWLLYGLTALLNTGITALIARRLGENRREQAESIAWQGLILAVLIGSLMSLVVQPLLTPALNWMGLRGDTLAQATGYLRTMGLGYVLIYVFGLIQAVMIGQGDTRAHMRMMSLALVLNMLLDPLLIYGVGGLAGLGLLGAGVANLLARGTAIGWGLWSLRSRGWLKAPAANSPDTPRWPSLTLTRQALRIGLPHATTGVIYCLVFVALTPILTGFGDPALAAMGIGQRIETVIFAVLCGFAVACTTLVGQNLGAQQAERAEQIVWATALQAALFNAVFMLVFWFASPWIVPLMTPDPTTQAHSIAYLRTISLALVPYSCELVFDGAFAGAGNTLPPMVIIVAGTVIRLPLALFYAHTLGLGAQGVWLAIATTMCIKGLVLLSWFRLGHWKHHSV
ncbi:MAG: MATE family efflux transporter [Candidatus Sericytochromatia bacterium]